MGWAGKVRRYVGESSRVWAWKVLGYGRGKCAACSRGEGSRMWLGMFEGLNNRALEGVFLQLKRVFL